MWAMIPESDIPKINDAVHHIRSAAPENYDIYVIKPDAHDKKGVADAEGIRTREALAETLAHVKGLKFRPEEVSTWHARTIPGYGMVLGDNAWDKHETYRGPEDIKVRVYIPRLIAEADAAEAQQQAQQARRRALAPGADVEAAPAKKTKKKASA